MDEFGKLKEALRERLPEVPLALVVLGSGLGGVADALEGALALPYVELPGLPSPSAPGHAGRLVVGRVGDKAVALMQGRFHYYEGFSMEEVTLLTRAFGELGTRYLIATNASGGINPSLRPGDLVLLVDHINFMGVNPLRGFKNPDGTPPFVDMTYVYDRELLELAESAAKELGIEVRRGVYVAFSGPSFETPAEIRMARLWGADVVGMSTVPEVMVARWLGMRVLAISCVANYAAGMTQNPLTHQEVLEEMSKAADKVKALLLRVISRLER